MAADMANVVKPRARVDATASKTIASRPRVGRVRHLHTKLLWVQKAVARRELTIAKCPGAKTLPIWGQTLGSEGDARIHEKSRLPHSRRTFKDGVEGRNGMRHKPATLRGHGNDWSKTSNEIDKKSRTSRMIPTTSRRNGETRQPEFRVHRVERGWIQKESCPATLDDMTCSLQRVR